jgi:hypothetical protein
MLDHILDTDSCFARFERRAYRPREQVKISRRKMWAVVEVRNRSGIPGLRYKAASPQRLLRIEAVAGCNMGRDHSDHLDWQQHLRTSVCGITDLHDGLPGRLEMSPFVVYPRSLMES